MSSLHRATHSLALTLTHTLSLLVQLYAEEPVDTTLNVDWRTETESLVRPTALRLVLFRSALLVRAASQAEVHW